MQRMIKTTEMEDESIVERQADVGIVKSSYLLSKRCGPGSVLVRLVLKTVLSGKSDCPHFTDEQTPSQNP